MPSLIKIERGSDGDPDFKYNNMSPFARKPGDINISMSAAPKLALVPASQLLLQCNLVIPQCMCQVSLRLKEVQVGTNDFKYNKVPFLLEKQGISILRCLLPRN